MEAPRPLSRSRRRTARNLARGLGLGALTALLAVAPPVAPARAAGGSAAVLAGPGGTSYALGEEALRAGTEGGTYTVRAHPGEVGESFTRTGVSVRQAMTLAGIDPESIGYVVVPRPDGSEAYLPRVDFAAAPPFEDGRPVLLSADSGCSRFLRPTSGPEDVNAEDIIAACGSALEIGVRDGEILTVRATASATKVDAGEAVRFTAVAEGAMPGEAVTFVWDFGDGRGTGSEVEHTFKAAGSYSVSVVATGSEESGGEAVPLTVVVGKAPVVRKSEAKRGATLNQGDAEGGVARGQVPGPLHSRTAGRFAQGSGDLPSGPSPGFVPHESAPPGPTPEAPAPVKRESEHEAVVPGRIVEGQLVADFVDAAEASASPGSRGSSAAVAAVPSSGAGAVPLTGVLAAALLVAGAAYEWRRQRRRA